jgi:Ca2+-binding EF-hand superfamily protein
VLDSSETEEPSRDKQENTSRRKRISFHDRRVIGYEDRIRAYSTPDKIFRYFATLRVTDPSGEDEILMTPEDFVRSLTPGVIQPEGLGLDQFRRVSRRQIEAELLAQAANKNLFKEMGLAGGLICFSDYLFLLTVLSTPIQHFEIAFKMFDLNGDGEVDASEFQKVCNILNKGTAVGQRHRDHTTTGSVSKGVGGALQLYFFGSDLKQRLTAEKFGQFQDKLQRELLRIEFEQHGAEDGIISEVNFCCLLLSFTNFGDSKKRSYRKRVKAAYGSKDRVTQLYLHALWLFGFTVLW